MATTEKLTMGELNLVLCDVRKAHRLINSYQTRMLDLAYFVKSKLDFPKFGGNQRFCKPIEHKRSSYDNLKVWKDMWGWDFLYSYVFEYYFGEKENNTIRMSLFQVSDTGYFDSAEEKKTRTNSSSFLDEEEAISKVIFFVEKKLGENWWKVEKIMGNDNIMGKTHLRERRNEIGNVQIIYSFPLNKFLNEQITLETLQEFVSYCNENGIEEMTLI